MMTEKILVIVAVCIFCLCVYIKIEDTRAMAYCNALGYERGKATMSEYCCYDYVRFEKP